MQSPVPARVGALDAAGSPPPFGEESAAGVKHGMLEVVPHSSHLLLMEDNAATMEAVEHFLDG